jgi:hypothetical protein
MICGAPVGPRKAPGLNPLPPVGGVGEGEDFPEGRVISESGLGVYRNRSTTRLNPIIPRIATTNMAERTPFMGLF